MLRRNGQADAPQTRSGQIAFWLLFALPIILMVLFLAVNSYLIYDAKTLHQNSIDSAVLAATGVLLDDRLLRQDSAEIDTLIAESRAAAQQYVELNPYAVGHHLDLLTTDVLFGYLDTPLSKTYLAYDPDNPNNLLGSVPGACFDPTVANPTIKQSINSVRIRGFRTAARNNPVPLLFGPLFLWPYADMVSAATATLDPFVVGFEAVGSQTVPLAPFALASDPAKAIDFQDDPIPANANPITWEYQVELQQGTDDYERVTGGFNTPASDDLFEMKVIIGSQALMDDSLTNYATVNTAILEIGAVTSIADRCTQLTGGITKQNLTDFGAPFLIDSITNQLVVPGTLIGPDPASADFTSLQNCLNALKLSDQPRAWPLYSGFSSGDPVITGFVAARITSVDVIVLGGVNVLTFTLQPCKMSTASAVTDSTRTNAADMRCLRNPYLSRLRMVE